MLWLYTYMQGCKLNNTERNCVKYRVYGTDNMYRYDNTYRFLQLAWLTAQHSDITAWDQGVERLFLSSLKGKYRFSFSFLQLILLWLFSNLLKARGWGTTIFQTNYRRALYFYTPFRAVGLQVLYPHHPHELWCILQIFIHIVVSRKTYSTKVTIASFGAPFYCLCHQ